MKIKKLLLTFLVAGLITLSAMQSNAQKGGWKNDTIPGKQHHHSIDSAAIAKWDSIFDALADSFKAHHHHDSTIVHHDTGHHHMDTIIFHKWNDSTIHAWIDSAKAHCKHIHDSIPPFPHDTLPVPHDSIPCHHDTIPPFPHDTIGGGWGGGDTLPFPNPGKGGGKGQGGKGGGGGKGGCGGRIELDNSNVATTIYPNPIVNSSVLHISNATGNLTFTMFDVSGKLVVSKENLDNGDYSINKGNLGSGIYIYNVYSGNIKVSSGKIMIQ